MSRLGGGFQPRGRTFCRNGRLSAFIIVSAHGSEARTSHRIASASYKPGVSRRTIRQGPIRLDAYDAAASAGAFYAKCGYREVGRVVYKKNPLVYYERLI